ncbi:MAG: hypothetical protein HYX75_14595 [Acidobacteria bacterium]|nr:hypothetical protein [Acidobacteriota bacterium]
MRPWIGKFIGGIGVVHTLFGLLGFRGQLAMWLGEGLWNTVNGQAEREFPFWFLSFGILAIIFGLFVDWVERHFGELPRFLGWSFLGLTVAVVVIMPISGGWLMFAPAVGAIRRASRSRSGSERGRAGV